ncbi:MAG: hypothetical protein NT177_09065, partial [Chloroflexi bacterium]|nr:hypothetical protein [Chloroflexota bacterium]
MSLNKTVMLVIALCFGLIFMACQNQPVGYPIDSKVTTTLERTVSPVTPPSTSPKPPIDQVSKFVQYGYGDWQFGGELAAQKRLDLMPPAYTGSSATKAANLLRFFTITDIHITDKESPAQIIYLQQLYYPNLLPPPFNALGHVPWSWQTSVYSPVMLYTTQVL